ncbi:MAG: hypothetical protein HYV08_10245 [Deltaproteobacteria bacterium]|nr:hypothetical protein [Deltaproteobacteria bacterium]MBI3077979.1 hypothetical protein [Deltaproteobacteria bacterium]
MCRWFPLGVCLAASLAGCAGARIRDGLYVHPDKGFQVALPTGSWERLPGSDVDLAFRHPSGAAGLLVNATCEGNPPRRPSRLLARHLLIGLTDKVVLRQEEVRLHGVPALYTLARGRYEGQPLEVQAFIIRARGCVYDLVYFVNPNGPPEGSAAFEAVVQSFRLLGPEG